MRFVELWFYLLTDEGNSAGIASKLTALATGIVALGLVVGVAWPWLRRIP